MKKSIGVFSCDSLSPLQLTQLVEKCGGSNIKANGKSSTYNGAISNGQHHVWIYLANNPRQELYEEENGELLEKLGGWPLTKISLEISRDSEHIAIDFLCGLAEKINFVATDWEINCSMWQPDDIRKIKELGLGFYSR